MGDDAPTTFELTCPGCGAYFRLKPKRDKPPKGPIPCPKCQTSIPIPAPAQTRPEDDPSFLDRPRTSKTTAPLSQAMGTGILKRKRRDGDSSSSPSLGKPDAAPTPPEPALEEHSSPRLNLPSALDKLFEDAPGPGSTFLGLPTLNDARRPDPDQDAGPTQPPLRAQRLEPGQAPHGELPMTSSHQRAASGSGLNPEDPEEAQRLATLDPQRSTREVPTAQLTAAQRPEHLRDTQEIEPVDPQAHRKTPISVERPPLELFDPLDDELDAPAMLDEPQGPFDLRDILAAEKERGNEMSGEITRNPALDGGLYPSPEPPKKKPLPEDGFGQLQRPRSRQLATLSVSSRAEHALRETSDRSNSGAFKHARVSTGDIFSETSLTHDERLGAPSEANADASTSGAMTFVPELGKDPLRRDEDAISLSPRTTAEYDVPAQPPRAAGPQVHAQPASAAPAPSPEEPDTLPDEPVRVSDSRPAVGLSALLKRKIQDKKAADAAEAPSPSASSPVEGLAQESSGVSSLDALFEEQGRSRFGAGAPRSPSASSRPDASKLAAASSEDEITLDDPNARQPQPVPDRAPAQAAASPLQEPDTAPTREALPEASLWEEMLGELEESSSAALAEREALDAQAHASTHPTRPVIPTLRPGPQLTSPAASSPDAPSPETPSHEAPSPSAQEPAPNATPKPRMDLLKAKLRERLHTSEAVEDKPVAAPAAAPAPPRPLFKPALSPPRADHATLKLEDPLEELGQDASLLEPSTPQLQDDAPAAAAPTPEPVAAPVPALEPEPPSPWPAFEPADASQEQAFHFGDDPRERSGSSLISGFPAASQSTDELRIIRSKRRRSAESSSGVFARPLSDGLGQESSVTLGAASERRGSGHIRLPTTEILEVLGRGSYRLMVEDIVYEPVDERGLVDLIKQGVLLGAEQIADADGDWTPIAEHPVFKRLRKKMAMEAHAVLAKYKRQAEQRPAPAQEKTFAATMPLTPVAMPTRASGANAAPHKSDASSAQGSPGSDELTLDLAAHEEETKQLALTSSMELELGINPSQAEDEAPDPLATAADPDDASSDASSDAPRAKDRHEGEGEGEGEDEGEDEDWLNDLVEDAPEPQDAPAQDDETQDAPDDAQALDPEAEQEEEPEDEPVGTTPAQAQEDEPAPTPTSKRWLIPLLLAISLMGALAAAYAIKPELFSALTRGSAPTTDPPAVATPSDTPAPDPSASPGPPAVDPQTDPEPDKPGQDPSPGLDKSPLERALGLMKENKHAQALPLLERLYEESPEDVNHVVFLSRALLGASRHAEARAMTLVGLTLPKLKKDEQEQLRALYKQSAIHDEALTQSKARALVKDDDLDALHMMDDDKLFMVKVLKEGKVTHVFKPAQVEWGNGWRRDVAAWRLCALLACPYQIPEARHAKITETDFMELFKRHDSELQRKGLNRIIEWKELDWVEERGADGKKQRVLYGSLQRWSAPATPFPIEATQVWKPLLDVNDDERELDQAIELALEPLKRFERGVHFEPVLAQAKQMTPRELSRQISAMLVVDYLINHRPRFQRKREDLGKMTGIHDGKLYSLTHGMSWDVRASTTVRDRLRPVSRFDRQQIQALRLIEPSFVDGILFPDADATEKKRLKTFWELRARALRDVDKLVEKYNAESVLHFP